MHNRWKQVWEMNIKFLGYIPQWQQSNGIAGPGNITEKLHKGSITHYVIVSGLTNHFRDQRGRKLLLACGWKTNCLLLFKPDLHVEVIKKKTKTVQNVWWLLGVIKTCKLAQAADRNPFQFLSVPRSVAACIYISLLSVKDFTACASK